MQKLTDPEIHANLATLEGWQTDDTTIWKEYTFHDFDAAMDFMNRLAVNIDKLNHHPDWTNSYNKVTIRLTSHEAKGLTAADFAVAQAAETIARLISTT